MARDRTRRRGRRPPPASIVRRWVALGGLVLVGALYVQPLRSYLETRGTVAAQAAEVRELRREHARLERRLAIRTSDAALLREARRLGWVKPGERLFVVKGIPAWRAARAAQAGGQANAK
jgi:cell division protein FtsB